MADIIKFCGRDRNGSKKKALDFYYDNYEGQLTREEFLARCRVQTDGVTIHFYPNLKVDMEEYSKLRAKRKQNK